MSAISAFCPAAGKKRKNDKRVMVKDMKVRFCVSVLAITGMALLLLSGCADSNPGSTQTAYERGIPVPDGYQGGISETDNPVYKVERVQEPVQGEGDTLYAACGQLPEEYQARMDRLFAGKADGNMMKLLEHLDTLEQGPAIVVFAHEEHIEHFFDPDMERKFLTRYMVSLFNRETGMLEELVYIGAQEMWALESPDMWQNLLAVAHLTGPDQPMYLVRDGSLFYAVIGDTAWCLTPADQIYSALPAYLPELVTDGFDIEVAELHFG